MQRLEVRRQPIVDGRAIGWHGAIFVLPPQSAVMVLDI